MVTISDRLLTTVFWLIRSVQTVRVPVALPQQRDAPVVRRAAAELRGRTVGDARAFVRQHVEVVGTGARVALAARCNEAQVRAAAVVCATGINTCKRRP